MAKKTPHKTGQKLGQHFLRNAAILSRIIESADLTQEDYVLEIGPGEGPMSVLMAPKCAKLLCVEVDKALIPVLEKKLSRFDNVGILCGDILQQDLPQLVREHFDGKPFKVVANLPYYITTPIVMMLLESKCVITQISVVVQKEAAERFTSKAGEDAYCASAALASYYAQITQGFTIPPEAFTPPPKVESALMCLKPYKTPPVQPENEKLFFKVLKAAFAMRRKTLVNNLASAFGMPRAVAEEILAQMGLDADIRGETLNLQQFAQISDLLNQKSIG